MSRKNMTLKLKCEMEDYWDRINWRLLSKIRRLKQEPTVWEKE